MTTVLLSTLLILSIANLRSSVNFLVEKGLPVDHVIFSCFSRNQELG